MNKLACQVVSMQLLNKDVYRIFLRMPAGHRLQHHAGQYLELLLPGGHRAPFSIANAAQDNQHEIELHIQHLPHRQNSNKVIQLLQQAPEVQVELPKGECYLQPAGTDPLLFIAAGTGFAQMKAMLESAFAQGLQQPLYLYWGVREEDGLYLPQLPQEWQQQHSNFQFIPVVENPSADWSGHCGMLHEAIAADFTDLSRAQVYASGSPGMVYAVMDHLVELGLQEDNIYSDVFSYAPREKV